MNIPTFEQVTLQGEEADTFLQGQLTVNVNKLGLSYQPAAIANLKGRVEFGIWIKKQGEKQFEIVIHSDCTASLLAHLKKYGAFSKFTTSQPITVYPCVLEDAQTREATFSLSEKLCDVWAWQSLSIASGNYWITQDSQGLFQPQELRLHQRGGVDYDKGCYLGQEVIARIYFKSAPKAFLHRVKGKGATPDVGESIDKIKVVNAIPLDSRSSGEAEFEALVIANPEHLNNSKLSILKLPSSLQGSVAREV